MAVQTFVAASATVPGVTITNVKSVSIEDTVQTLEIYADGADVPTIFPWGRKRVYTIEAVHVEGKAGGNGAVSITGAQRANSLPAPGSGATFSYSDTGIVTNVRNSAPQVDGGQSSGSVTVVVPLAVGA
jgi:hypothetical protein